MATGGIKIPHDLAHTAVKKRALAGGHQTGTGSKIELRELAKRLDAEGDLSNQESKQLRELWLTVNDALDDNQRQIIRAVLADQLQRSADQKTESNSSRQKGDLRGRGMNRQKPGGVYGGSPQ